VAVEQVLVCLYAECTALHLQLNSKLQHKHSIERSADSVLLLRSKVMVQCAPVRADRPLIKDTACMRVPLLTVVSANAHSTAKVPALEHKW
jgi:hypothetical protein